MIPPHGGQLRPIAERFGLPLEGLLDFSANINPEGPPASVFTTLHKALEDPATLTDYPDLQQSALKQAIASYAQVTAQNIVVANGFVPLLEAVLRTLPIRRCLLPVPAFNEYRKALARARVEVVPHPLSEHLNFRYDLDSAPRTDAILMANPQNPTGVLHDLATILAIVKRAAREGVHVLLDEAFIDYTPEHSLAPLVERYPNLIVFRSVTKFHGIPGLRVAYLAANPALTAEMELNLPPWPITTLAAEAVRAALTDLPYAERTRMLNRERREYVQHELHNLGIATYPAAANYLLLRPPSHMDTNNLWQRLIREHGIVLRDCANYEALAPGHLRAAIRTEPANERLIEALRQAMQGPAKQS
ncbi:L-threonine O-3-phosphate decarboxylase [Granulicella rosea]|uniref:Aminotransferase n=1 Tax=Granulicella rosea TaxID=474952 RepID=A0A239IPI8_9BACT|nr:threonine-phosphate decarboxylase [Granulicella rosea]SNS94334.1 L-threonine O-3-phosphate decarboxylase [Granulicella rosea]